jgi:Tfp pilus assembly protein PilF
MKRICLIVLLLVCACKHFDTRSNQKKAEDAAKHYLDSALNGRGDFKNIVFGKVDTILDTVAKSKHQVKGWSLYATYQGNDAYGAYEVHKIIVKIDSSFSKVLSVNNYKP